MRITALYNYDYSDSFIVGDKFGEVRIVDIKFIKDDSLSMYKVLLDNGHCLFINASMFMAEEEPDSGDD